MVFFEDSMKKALLLLLLIIITGCSPKLLSIRDTSITPHKYKKPLFVTVNYFSNKSKFAQFFNNSVKSHKKVSKINNKILVKLLNSFGDDGIDASSCITRELLEENTFKPNRIIENEDVLSEVKENKSDLLVKVIPSDINSFWVYNGGMNGGSIQKVLRVNYTITAIDLKSKKEVWKGTYTGGNANALFSRLSTKLSKKIHAQMMEDQIF